MRLSRTLVWTLTLLITFTSFPFAQPVAQLMAQDNEESKTPSALQFYKGRRIAQTMHYEGAPWLIRENRENEERCSLMLANMDLKTGMTVCDMGCGNGFYSLQMAKMIGPEGIVLAVDIQPQMLYLMRQRMNKAGIDNIAPILGSFHNPHLPRNTIDVILMVDVYHEFSHPEHMLRAMRNSLKDPKVPIKPLHKMSKKKIMVEYKANGFKLAKEYEKLPWQHMMFFEKDPEWKAPEAPKSDDGE